MGTFCTSCGRWGGGLIVSSLPGQILKSKVSALIQYIYMCIYLYVHTNTDTHTDTNTHSHTRSHSPIGRLPSAVRAVSNRGSRRTSGSRCAHGIFTWDTEGRGTRKSRVRESQGFVSSAEGLK
jgi:hypothetical protein